MDARHRFLAAATFFAAFALSVLLPGTVALPQGSAPTGRTPDTRDTAVLTRSRIREVVNRPILQPVIIRQPEMSVFSASWPGAEAVLDGDPATRWLVKQPWPQGLVLNLGAHYYVSGLQYHEDWTYARQYQIFVSADPERWGEPIAEGVIQRNGETRISFPPKYGSHVKLALLGSSDPANAYCYVTEINILYDPAHPRHSASMAYYVSPAGNNAARGTINSPWRNIWYGCTRLKAGDTLMVRGGTYQENIAAPNMASNGAPGKWISVRNYPGELVVLRPEKITTDVISIDASYWVFDGIHVDGTNMQPHEWAISGIGIGNNSHHIAIRNAIVSNCGAAARTPSTGIFVNAPEVVIELCTLVNNGYGIYAGYNSNITIRNCMSYSNSGCGIQYGWHLPGTASNTGLVYNNLCYRNEACGIAIGDQITVYNNVCYGNIGPGIIIYGASEGAKIYNNTLDANGTGIKAAGQSTNILVRNNSITSSTDYAIYLQYPNDTGWIIENNTFFESRVANLFAVAGATFTLANNITANPRYIDARAGDFRLQSGSGNIRSGKVLAEVPFDFIGTPRSGSQPYDIGAFQYTNQFTGK